jgi:rubredoxin
MDLYYIMILVGFLLGTVIIKVLKRRGARGYNDLRAMQCYICGNVFNGAKSITNTHFICPNCGAKLPYTLGEWEERAWLSDSSL